MSNSLSARAALTPTLAVAALSLFATSAVADPAQGVLVSRATGVNGTPFLNATLLSVSPDGTQVTFSGTDPATNIHDVYIRNTKTNVTATAISINGTPAPTPPPIPPRLATLPADATVLSASATRKTVTYKRTLTDGTTAVGFATAAGAWIVARTAVRTHVDADGKLCPFVPYGPEITHTVTPSDLRISADGSHLWLDSHTTVYGDAYDTFPGDTFATRIGHGGTFQSVGGWFGGGIHPTTFTLLDLGETGQHMLSQVGTYNQDPVPLGVTPAADATGPALPELPTARDGGGLFTTNARFFAHDTGIVRTEYSYLPSYTQKVYLYPPVVADPGPSTETAATPGPDDIVDSVALAGTTVKLPCDPAPTPTPSGPAVPSPTPTVTVTPTQTPTATPTATPTPAAPLGTAAQYAPITLASPALSTKSAGSVKVTLAPAGVRAATSSTITVKTFGLAVWSKKVTASATIALPNALLFLPEGVNVTTAVPASATAPAATVVGTRTWQAFK